MMVQQTLGWLCAYPEKTISVHDLAETIDTAAMPIIPIKQLVTPSISIARG